MTTAFQNFNLEEFIHPRNSRIIITPFREVFMAAAKNRAYSAAIWQRPEMRTAEKQEQFRKAASAMERRAAKFQGVLTGSGIKLNVPPELEPVRPDLEVLSRVHYELQPDEGVSVVFARVSIAEKPHLHLYRVVNCNFLFKGTRLFFEDGVEESVEMGDVLCMQPGVIHAPTVPPDNRVKATVIMVPASKL